MEGTIKSCKEISLRQTARFLKKHHSFIILTHASPDGDTLGAAYALYYGIKGLGKSAKVLCPDEIPAKYDYFTCETDDVAEDSVVVAVDVADKRLLGTLEEKYGDRVELNIDHHISNTRYAQKLWLDAGASATCEMMYELLCQMKVRLSDRAAKALYTGIATDTGSFKYSSVTARTHMIAAKLHRHNIDASNISKVMFDTKSKRLLELERMVLDGAEYHFDDKCMLLSVTSQMQNETGCTGTELEGIAVISRSVEGVQIGITVKQTGDDTYKVSVRTYEPFDASKICKLLGGGGHKQAAGATVMGTLDEVKAQALDSVKKAMEETNGRTSAS